MKVFKIHENVESGQCKGALVRIQVKTTALFILSGAFPGFAGSRVGICAPGKYENGKYKFNKFYFHPWFAPDIAVYKLPGWYKMAMKFLSFG